MKLTDRKLTKVFFSSEIRIGPDNPKLETGTCQSVTSWPPSTPNRQDHDTTKRRSWGRLQMIGIKTSTTLTGGAALQLGAISYKGKDSSISRH